MKTPKDPDFTVHSVDPEVGGPPPERITQSILTPTALFFVRSHGDVPDLDAEEHAIVVDGLVGAPRRWRLADLRRFERVSLTATLQCAGNRRDELMRVAPIPGEVPWSADGISTALWEGVRLGDVLRASGLRAEAAHIALTGLDTVTRHGHSFGFGGSLPLSKALSPEVLLVDRMNGDPLPASHGGPVRVVVPGYIGARSVKWLGHIAVQAHPSDNYFQAKAYRLFTPEVTADLVRWEDGLPLGEQSLNACITTPLAGERLAAGRHRVAGWAFAGGERRVAHVRVSPDGGHTWCAAELEAAPAYTWQRWQVALDLPPGTATLIVRAWDTAGNTMPEHPAAIWNFKGYMNNAWHRVAVQVA